MRKFLVFSLAALLLAGCKTPPPVNHGETSSQAQSSDNTSNAVPANSTPQAEQLSPEQQAQEALKQVGFVIYFDFDKSEIRQEYNAVIAAHAKYLTSNPGIKVRLEGNTDERGSREYNIGLGERRAQAVRRALMLLGVSESQITTLSYGEERPAVPGHDEAAYAKDRRVDIVYN
ncbi:MAG TPA: peptidoglycan-associated lipoprotein Pal [Steroidobacteraceae bacterium]|nr:peptidoglycan-associated lipoprotein Pal [Steroidobacteraceae bacterium]